MHVAVIGAGLAGLCSASSLQRAGCRVTVIDRRAAAGLETSFANAGLITPSMAQPWNTPGVHRALLKSLGRDDAPVQLRPRALLSMGRWGIEFLRQSRPDRYLRNAHRNFRLAAFSMRVLDEQYAAAARAAAVRADGALYLYRSAAEFAAGQSEADALALTGLRYRVLSADECAAREPLLAPIAGQLAGGIDFMDDRSGDALAFCQAVAAALAAAGAAVQYGVTALGFERRGRRVSALRTSVGSLAADAFVIAAGSYSTSLARGIGVRLPIYPVKGNSLSLRCGAPPALPSIPVVDASLHTAITPIDGVLRVAGTAEFNGFDTTVSPARMRALASVLARIYPALATPDALAGATGWAGLRPMCPDGVPLIGRTAVENVYVNAGHGHLGWTLATASGELLSATVTGGRCPIDVADYAIRGS